MASPTLAALRAAFAREGSVAVAFSGGVDSAVLAKVAADVLGDRALAVIVDGPSYAATERETALAFARDLDIPHAVVVEDDLADPAYAANPVDRCAVCRDHLADAVFHLADERGLARVAAGTNTDDVAAARFGDARLKARGVWQPYVELGVDKAGVRALARELGLPVADKPSMACLSSRIPTGERITVEKLRRVERAEAWLAARGYRVVRVRSIGDRARVEVAPEEVARLQGEADAVREALEGLGFATAEIDPRGYGSRAALRVLPR